MSQLLAAQVARAAPPWNVSAWINSDRPLVLADLRGRVVALHAFQMLCPGCVSHGIPQAQRIAAQFRPEQVSVVGLHSVFEHHDAMGPVSLAAFLYEYRVRFPVAIDEAGVGTPIPRTMEAYQMRGTPTLILLDKQGRLRLHAFGRPEDMAVGAAIATLLAEPYDAASDLAERGDAADVATGPMTPPACDDDGCSV